MTELLAALRDSLCDRYTVEREIGRGGAAVVFLGHDIRHQRRVAIKVLRDDLASELAAERFLREIAFAATLAHPNILPLFDSGAANGLLYYVMPFVEGESLRSRLQREGPLPLDDAVRIAGEVADALAHAHAHNILHRDIKPENILLEAGHAVVSDFGIARALDAQLGERLTRTGLSVGTPAYMSPEQASGDDIIDGRSDVYALGCVLYEMVGGEPPVTGHSPRAILARQIAGEIRALEPLRPGVPATLVAIVQKALAPNPADRFATAAELAVALETHRSGGSKVPSRSSLGRRWRPASGGRTKRLLLSGGVMLMLAAVYGAGTRVLEQRRLAAARGVAVLPFRVHSGGEEWTEALADLLATTLEGTPGLRVVDPWALWRPLRETSSARATSPDPENADRLSRQLGARHFILGSLTQTGALYQLTLRIYGTGSLEPIRTVSAEAPRDSVSVLIQRAALQVIAELAPTADPLAARRVEMYATDSAAALKAYLDARSALRRGLFDEADQSITEALRIDTAFALAAVEALTIRSWRQWARGEQYTGLRELADLALRHQDELSERQRLRAQLSKASVEADGVRANELAERIVQLDSADIDAWSLLAYIHQVYGWQYGGGSDEALQAAERAVQLDSTHVPALFMRSHLAIASGDADDMRRQLVRIRGADTSTSALRAAELSVEALLRDESTLPRLLDSIISGPQERWVIVFRDLRSYRPARAEQFLDALLARPGAGFPQRFAVGARAQLWLGEGRLAAVDSSIRAGTFGERSTLPPILYAGIVAAALVDVGDPDLAARALASIEQYIPADSAAALLNSRPVWWLGWIIGAYHATHGDTAMARRWHVAIGTLPRSGHPETYREAIQADIEARLAHRRGHQQLALELAHEAYDLWRIHIAGEFESRPAPSMRFHLAQQLRNAGLPDSADALLRSLVPPTTWMGTLTARSAIELARSAEDRRDHTEAARYYEMALLLWERGGPEVRRWREEAREGLQRTGAEGGSIRVPWRRRG